MKTKCHGHQHLLKYKIKYPDELTRYRNILYTAYCQWLDYGKTVSDDNYYVNRLNAIDQVLKNLPAENAS